MTTEKYTLDKINTKKDLDAILSVLSAKYGIIKFVDLKNKKGQEYKTLKRYYSQEEFLLEQDESLFEATENVSISMKSPTNVIVVIQINKKTKEMEVKIMDTIHKTATQPLEKKVEFSEDMIEENNIYYKFDNGVIARYDSTKFTYYILDNDGKWNPSRQVLTWIMSAEHDYVELKKNENKEGKKIL